MAHLLVSGDWEGAFEVLVPLYEAGHRLTLARADPDNAAMEVRAFDLLVLAAGPATAFPQVGAPGTSTSEPRWICWNRRGDLARADDARRAGALAVLPADTSGASLERSVCDALVARAAAPAVAAGQHRYAREEIIFLVADAVLEVRAGVVAQTVVHDDGLAVLLGLCGPGQCVVGHPDDSCSLYLVAHTDVTVVVRPWASLVAESALLERIRARARQMEAWSAAQAHRHLDQRLLGILAVLAEQFGVPQGADVLIDVRITHAQLATAVGATRTTVTRLIGELRGRGQLATSGSGADERFRLPAWPVADHDLR